MPIKSYKPVTPTRRFQTVTTRDDITKDRPEKGLVTSKKRTGGRNSTGRVTSRFIGGGAKQAYRVIDFKRDKTGIPAVVAAIEYDPNRSARIALLNYADGEKRYIIHPDGLKVGQKLMSGPEADILTGNALPLKNMPAGTIVHNIELKPGKGAQVARSAGGYAQLVGRDQGMAILRLNSGEQRVVHGSCMATVGAVSNPDHGNINDGTAGRTVWRGKRPHNRGVTMNPVDHPHGGGEGRTSGGRHPVSPWGKPTKGKKTRSNKATDKFILRSRHQRKS